MRVLYFTRDDSPHDQRFLRALAETGEEIYCLRLEKRGNLEDLRPVPTGIHLVDWKGGQKPIGLRDIPGLLIDLKRVLRDLRPDVVHAGPIQNAACLAALSGFQPLVSMSWGSDMLVDADRGPAWKLATRFTLRQTRVLLGDCQAVRDKAISLGFPSERVILFPWGVDLDHYSPGDGIHLRDVWGWKNQFVLFCNRSWEPIYGVDVVARAFVLALKICPDLRLVMAGRGSQEHTLRSILEEGGGLDHVYFPGLISQRELPDFYRAADLYISASHSDGSSVSLLEALACGRPVAVSDIPGNREWVIPGKAGWLFQDGDPQALANCIVEARKMQVERRIKICIDNRALAQEHADWSANQKKLVEAYQLALRG